MSLAFWGFALQVIGILANLSGGLFLSKSLIKHVPRIELPTLIMSALFKSGYAKGVAKIGFGEIDNLLLLRGLALVVVGMTLQLFGLIICELAQVPSFS